LCNVTALEGLHVTGKYRDRSMTHTCSRHAAWDPHPEGREEVEEAALVGDLALSFFFFIVLKP